MEDQYRRAGGDGPAGRADSHQLTQAFGCRVYVADSHWIQEEIDVLGACHRILFIL